MSESPSLSETPAATTNANVGSVADYKSVAQPFVAEIGQSMDKLDEFHCFNLPDADVVPLCNATILSAGMQAKTVGLSLRGAMKPGVPAYIGDLPPELETVMDKTLTAADGASAAAESWSDADCPDSSNCRRLGLDVSMAFEDLSDQLGTWTNY